MRKLGSKQREVLDSLRRHGSWHRRCGWVWDTISGTERVLNSLVRAGHASVAKGVYRPVAKIGSTHLVVLSDGTRIRGDDPVILLNMQHRILLKLSEAFAVKYGEGAAQAQEAIADANLLGLEVVDRLTEEK